MTGFCRVERDMKEPNVKSNLATVHLPMPAAKNSYSTLPGMGNHQLVIISQLLRIIDNVQHIDDLFLWLVHTLLKRLDIDVIQFWTLQGHVGGQVTLELRTMVSRNLALPQYVVVNPDVASQIRSVLKERSGLMPMPVGTVFPQDQVNLLTKHNLHYWTCCFLCDNSMLPPAMGKYTDSKEVYTPLTMAASLFTQQSPSLRLLPTIGHVLEQSILLAKKRGLLLPDGKQTAIPLPPSLVKTTRRLALESKKNL
jgi:hypothetical protein